MKYLNKIIFFIFAIGMLNLMRVANYLISTALPPNGANNSNKLAIGKMLYDAISPDRQNKAHIDYEKYEHVLQSLCSDYSRLSLILAISLHFAIKYNLSAKSNLLIQTSISSIIKRLVCFYFSSQFSMNFNKNVTGSCYMNYGLSKETKVTSAIMLGNGGGIMVTK